MIITLDEAHQLLDRQLDGGAAFAQLKCFKIKIRRSYHWSEGRLVASEIDHDEIWVLRSFHTGAWGVIVTNSFAELQKTHQRVSHLASEISMRINPESLSVKDLMVSKPIRQLSHKTIESSCLPELSDISLLIDQLENVNPKNTDFNYQDARVEFNYWDSEHTRGESEYLNADLKVTHFDQEYNCPTGEMTCHSSQNCNESFDLQQLPWAEEIRQWTNIQGQEEFKGLPPEDMEWIFSHKSFAKLIHATLGPTLCLEKPEPFYDKMNPGSLIGQKLSHECLTILSSPNIITSKSFLDQEGVPARRIVLIENGELKNFIFTRLSAFHLSRSLPIDKQKVLAGSARTMSSNYSARPDLQYIEVLPGDVDSVDLSQSHLYIPDLEVTKLNSAGDAFQISIPNSLVSKYGGLHKRHIGKMSIHISRDELWEKLESLGDGCEKVFLPAGEKFLEIEKYTLFQVPMAKFKGFKCTLS